jgi:hypothetical protein
MALAIPAKCRALRRTATLLDAPDKRSYRQLAFRGLSHFPSAAGAAVPFYRWGEVFS